jgi:hypothetical protein
LAKDLKPVQDPVTLQGKTLHIVVNNGTVTVQNATVTLADNLASNGVVHLINRVLIPPAQSSRRLLAAPTPGPAPTLPPVTLATCESGLAYDPACKQYPDTAPDFVKQACPKAKPFLNPASVHCHNDLNTAYICCYGTPTPTAAPNTSAPVTAAPTAGNGTTAPATAAPAGNGTTAPATGAPTFQSSTSVTNKKMLYVFTITETGGLVGQVSSVSLYRNDDAKGLFPEFETLNQSGPATVARDFIENLGKPNASLPLAAKASVPRRPLRLRWFARRRRCDSSQAMVYSWESLRSAAGDRPFDGLHIQRYSVGLHRGVLERFVCGDRRVLRRD